MTTASANDYLVKYGWIFLVVAVGVGAAIAMIYSDSSGPENAMDESQGTMNKSQVMRIVERGAGQECEWDQYSGDAGRIDCVQKFNWRNQSYQVHEYFDVELVNSTVEITQ